MSSRVSDFCAKSSASAECTAFPKAKVLIAGFGIRRPANRQLPQGVAKKGSPLAQLWADWFSRPSAPEGRADRPYVEKHLLWPALRAALDGDETIPSIPADSIPVGVGDYAATAHFISHSQTDAESF